MFAALFNWLNDSAAKDLSNRFHTVIEYTNAQKILDTAELCIERCMNHPYFITEYFKGVEAISHMAGEDDFKMLAMQLSYLPFQMKQAGKEFKRAGLVKLTEIAPRCVDGDSDRMSWAVHLLSEAAEFSNFPEESQVALTLITNMILEYGKQNPMQAAEYVAQIFPNERHVFGELGVLVDRYEMIDMAAESEEPVTAIAPEPAFKGPWG